MYNINNTTNKIINVVDYYGNKLSNELIEKNIINEFMAEKNIKTEEKSKKRLMYGKQQIDRFAKSNKKNTSVQVRNKYEAIIIREYALSINLLASTYKSKNLITNNVKKMTIRLRDYDSGCSKSECSCARNHIIIENIKKPVIYVLIQKNTYNNKSIPYDTL